METGGRQATGGRQETDARGRQETGYMGKTGDRRREMGDNALTSKAVYENRTFAFLE